MWIASIFLGIACAASSVQADGWAVCNGCHNGMMAPNKDTLAAKYKTAEELINGAQASESPMMSGLKQNTDALKAAAAAIGLGAENNKE
jgi:hypothetical protein